MPFFFDPDMKLAPAKSNPLIFPERPTTSTRTVAGTIIRYTISNSNLDFAESMEFEGPTTQALVAMVRVTPWKGVKF